MCGIFGYVGELSAPVAETCLATLAHRGPDGSGLWQTEEITLGHRRLAILDLSNSGRQPMEYGEGRYRITFNGEIYNFLEIRSELTGKGHRFRSDTDTEVILAAYAEWGPDCLRRFNGMWAFAIWDDVEKSLFLARDRFGKKPLFYSHRTGGFAFASEMKALFPLLDQLQPSADFAWMRRNVFLYEATEKCLIEGVMRFPAGHYGYVKNGRLSLSRWWNTLDHLVEVPRRSEEQVERFRELFVDACRIRMRSDVPVGTALSGGLDSSATICTMAHIAHQSRVAGDRISSDWQHAFVATFPGTPLDESRYARMVTDHLGITASFLEIDPRKSIDALDDMLYKLEELNMTSPIPMVQTYAGMRAAGVVVTIDGHGADELLAGYPSSLPYAFPDCGLNPWAVSSVKRAYRESFPKGEVQFKATGTYELPFLNYMARHVAKRLLGRKEEQSRDSGHPNFSRLSHLNRHLYILTHDTILPTLLRNYDRYAMTNGVEIRMPFMDHRIVTFAMSLPWTGKIRDGYTKRIIRDAIGPYMPADIAFRKSKIGFNTPIVDWMQRDLKEYFLDTVHSQAFATSSLIDADKVRAQVERIIHDDQAKYQEGEQAWTSLVPFLWERAVLNRPRPEVSGT
jgi:asparagine synthase (glutamine-hydrolysing)